MHLYQQQLRYIFDRPVTQPEWYWVEQEEPMFEDEDPMTAFVFIETLLQGIKADLQPYSNDQIGVGLGFVFNETSNLPHDFRKAAVPYERKVAALRSLVALFRDVFEPRCMPVTSASAQEMVSKINNVCYMFWDVCPLSNWNGKASETNGYYSTIAEVMEYSIRLNNPACIESGLHGLGHLATFHSRLAVPIIDRFLKTPKKHDPQLLRYAEAARTGMIL